MREAGPDFQIPPPGSPKRFSTMTTEGPRRWAVGFAPGRSTVEFLIFLLIGVLFFRAFSAEAYIVPTGSMAPTLLGVHRDYVCPNCAKRFSLGIDDFGRVGRPVCPNCGQTELSEAPASDSLGDRLLVQKFLYDLRSPRRWEVAVFQNPADLSQAYVKRVVGLPGESLLLWGGDVYINGAITRKTLEEASAMALRVYDHNYPPKDSARYPRWVARRGDPRSPLDSGWKSEGSNLLRATVPESPSKADWIDYRHWQPDAGNYGPIRDYSPYNGADVPGEHRVSDLIVTAKFAVSTGCDSFSVRVNSGGDRFVVTLPTRGSNSVEVFRNGRKLPILPAASLSPIAPGLRKFRSVQMGVVDRRLSATLDGKLLFAPFDFDDMATGPNWSASPVAFGVTGTGEVIVKDILIDRDVYYTEALAQTPRRPHGVETPFALGPGEFFVLGDNSMVSNDSRFWPGRPVVTSELFLGKPFLVHLPSQAVPLKVFGQDLYWIPDPREIRYIR